jgi:hypothetical protein
MTEERMSGGLSEHPGSSGSIRLVRGGRAHLARFRSIRKKGEL